MVSARPSPAAFSPLLRSTSTGPHALPARLARRPDTWLVPAGGAVDVPARLTRYTTVPCAGTDALIAPDVVVTAFDQRSVSRNEVALPRPAAVAVVAIVAVDPVSLNSATATSPSSS